VKNRTHTYTLRIPGRTAWAGGLTEHAAIRELHKQKRQGQHLSVYRDSDGVEVYQLDYRLVDEAEYNSVLDADEYLADEHLADDWSRGIA
jgi:hypothetical protein